MDVSEIMTSPVQTARHRGHAELRRQDDARPCGGLPARRRRVGQAVGVLTDRDIALSAYEYGEALWRLRDRRLHAPARLVVRRRRRHRDRRAPHAPASRAPPARPRRSATSPIGMISLDDLAHASRQPVIDPTPGLTTDELGDVYDATSGRSKHERRSGLMNKISKILVPVDFSDGAQAAIDLAASMAPRASAHRSSSCTCGRRRR